MWVTRWLNVKCTLRFAFCTLQSKQLQLHARAKEKRMANDKCREMSSRSKFKSCRWNARQISNSEQCIAVINVLNFKLTTRNMFKNVWAVSQKSFPIQTEFILSAYFHKLLYISFHLFSKVKFPFDNISNFIWRSAAFINRHCLYTKIDSTNQNQEPAPYNFRSSEVFTLYRFRIVDFPQHKVHSMLTVRCLLCSFIFHTPYKIILSRCSPIRMEHGMKTYYADANKAGKIRSR